MVPRDKASYTHGVGGGVRCCWKGVHSNITAVKLGIKALPQTGGVRKSTTGA